MKFSHFIHPRLSFAATVTGGDVDGIAVDTRGFEQIQPCVAVDQLPLDGVVDWKVQQVDNLAGDNPVDLTGAVGKTILVTDDTIVAVADFLADADYTVAAQPANPSRLRIEVIDSTPSISAGEVQVDGTDQDGKVVSETIATVAAGIFTTSTVFATVTRVQSIGVAGLGGSSDETIEVGVDNSSGVHIGRIDGTQAPRFLRIITFNLNGATGNKAGWFNLYTQKRQPTDGEYGPAEFGFQL